MPFVNTNTTVITTHGGDIEMTTKSLKMSLDWMERCPETAITLIVGLFKAELPSLRSDETIQVNGGVLVITRKGGQRCRA